MSRPTRSSSVPQREDLAGPAPVQPAFNTSHEGCDGALRVFAVKRVAFACEVKIGFSLFSAQPTD
jgi:hypothetical protein